MCSLTPSTKYSGKIIKCFSSVWYVIPLLVLGANLACLIRNIGASAHPMMEFSGFYESHEPSTSGNVRGIVPPHCDGHQNGKQSGYISHHCCVDCCPGGRLGDMEHQVIARWRRPVASGEALLWWRPVASDEALSCFIEQCAPYRNGAPPWPWKWPVKDTTAYFDCCNRRWGPSYGPLKSIVSCIIVHKSYFID